MGLNAKYKELTLADGIIYGTSMNMNATQREAFISGFNLEPCKSRPNTTRAIYHFYGQKLRGRLDSGDMVVRNGRLVIALPEAA